MPSLHLQGQEEEEQFDSFTYQISSEEQDAKELQEEVEGEQQKLSPCLPTQMCTGPGSKGY